MNHLTNLTNLYDICNINNIKQLYQCISIRVINKNIPAADYTTYRTNLQYIYQSTYYQALFLKYKGCSNIIFIDVNNDQKLLNDLMEQVYSKKVNLSVKMSPKNITLNIMVLMNDYFFFFFFNFFFKKIFFFTIYGF